MTCTWPTLLSSPLLNVHPTPFIQLPLLFTHHTSPPFSTTTTTITKSHISAIMVATILLSPYTLLFLPLIYYFLPYIRNNTIRHIPGPTLAIFSNLWLLYQCRRGRRYLAVDQAHKRLGPLVRIQPDHVSVADPEAIPVVYSHTGGWLKR